MFDPEEKGAKGLFGDLDLAAVRAAVRVRRMEDTGEHLADVHGSIESWVVRECRQSRREARRIVRLGRKLRWAPLTESALLAGTLPLMVGEVICSRLSASVASAWAEAEERMLERIAGMNERHATQVMDTWRRHASPDGDQPAEPAGLHISPVGDVYRIDGEMSVPDGQVVAEALKKFERGLPGEDTRTPAQRRMDALVDICRFGLEQPGSVRMAARPHLVVVMHEPELHAERPYAEYLDGRVVPTHETQAILCDCVAHTLLTGQQGAVLSYGRGRRTASDAQRTILMAVWGGCAMCGEPAWRCDIHHTTPWQHGGRTDLEDMLPLCRHCHRQSHLHQWRFRPLTNGEFEIRTPEGNTRTLTPPGHLKQAS